MLNIPSKIVLALLLATSPAVVHAQTTTLPASTTEQSEATSTALESDGMSLEPQAEPVEGQIVLQSENSVLAKELVGTSVYSPSEESLGEINDLIVNLDGTVEGVVIGVGGFFGFGEKSVAVELETLRLNPESYGTLYLVLNASKQDLEAAPTFKTAIQQQYEKEAQEARSDQLPESSDSDASNAGANSNSTE